MKQEDKPAIKMFTDLHSWQESHKLVMSVYSLAKTFPKEELFALSSQIRRAAVSITSNIAEGFSRATPADKVHFYVMAHGSLTEVQNQLIIARDVGYCDNKLFSQIFDQAITAHKLISGLIKSTKIRN